MAYISLTFTFEGGVGLRLDDAAVGVLVFGKADAVDGRDCEVCVIPAEKERSRLSGTGDEVAVLGTVGG